MKTKKNTILEIGLIFKDMGKLIITFIVLNIIILFIALFIINSSSYNSINVAIIFGGVGYLVLNIFFIYNIVIFYFDVFDKFKTLSDLEEN